jgi:hypothetical protein
VGFILTDLSMAFFFMSTCSHGSELLTGALVVCLIFAQPALLLVWPPALFPSERSIHSFQTFPCKPPFYLFSNFSPDFIPKSQTRKIRPLIKLKTSQKSVTPPTSEAFNKEGEDELNDEEEAPRPSKRRQSSSRAATGQAQGKGKGKGKARAPTPATPSTSSCFPPIVRKTRGKSKMDELQPYVPPRPVPTMDTVRLAAESLAKEQSEPTVATFSYRD